MPRSSFVNEVLPTILVMLKNIADTFLKGVMESGSDSESEVVPAHRLATHILRVHDNLMQMNQVISAALHDFRVTHSRVLIGDELGYWVRPRSTAWFSQFLLHEYEDDRWVELFRFNKASISHLARVLAPHCERSDTK